MRNWLVIISLTFSMLLLMSNSSCESQPSQQRIEQTKVEKNMKVLQKVVEIPQLKNSLDRVNTKKRLELFDDPNKVSYVYLISYGRVMAHYVIKGKITSGNKRLTSTERLIKGRSGGYTNDIVMESPSLDGSYGHSSKYVFFWTTEGSYVQWNGEYMLCDMPLKLATKPELIKIVK